MALQWNKIVRTPFTTYLLYANVVRQRQFIQKYIVPELEPYRAAEDKSLTEKDFRKITSYYGFGVPAVLGEAICTLRGIPMSFDERMASTSQGAITGLFDDFFDEWGMPEEKLIQLVNHPEHYPAENANQELFIKYYIRSLDLCQHPYQVKASLMDVLHAQTASLKQAGSKYLNTEELTYITKHKGGHSLLFYRHIFDHDLEEAERTCLFTLGAALQLVNDCFDVYKDHQAAIQTLVTRANHISTVRNQYHQWINDFFAQARALDYPKEQKEQFIRMISLGVRRADVCLQQLERLEALTKDSFCVDQYERKQLIVDMDTLKNILKSVWFHMQMTA